MILLAKLTKSLKCSKYMSIIIAAPDSNRRCLLSTDKCKTIDLSEENILRSIKIGPFTRSAVDFRLNFADERIGQI